MKTTKQELEKPKHQRRLVTTLKVIGYALMWLLVWSCVAFGFAIAGLSLFAISIGDGGTFTAQQANNAVLYIVLATAAIFFGIAWLLRKKKTLSYRVSRTTLIICTTIGLMIFVPLSLMGVWQSEGTPSQQNTVKQTDSIKDVKRYQYMLCSDGSYRSYTDKQMKDSRVGFTKDSEDYCKKNGQGKMSKLSDSLDEAKANGRSSMSAEQTEAYYRYLNRKNCTMEDIPYKTEREPASWLYEGHEEVASFRAGSDGYREICKDSSGKVVSNQVIRQPQNKVIYYGTRAPKQEATTRPNVDLNALCAHTPANSTYRADCIESKRRQYYGN